MFGRGLGEREPFEGELMDHLESTREGELGMLIGVQQSGATTTRTSANVNHPTSTTTTSRTVTMTP